MAACNTLDDLFAAHPDLTGKRVVLRADLNVPVLNGDVTDDTRIARVAPTIRELAEKGAAVIVLSHFGRPKGEPNLDYSLRPVAASLQSYVDRPVEFIAANWAEEGPEAAVARATPGHVLLLENTRFHPGEETDDPAFAKRLGLLGDVYVNDAFSAAHRAHASTHGIARLLPAYVGRAMEAELAALDKALLNPEHPVVAIVGGAKVSTKLDLIGNLASKVDVLVIGGAMANTFLLAQGREVGASLVERDLVETARAMEAEAAANDCQIVLPVDAVVATALKSGTETRTVSLDEVRPDEMILDAGPSSVAVIAKHLEAARTLVWNGPLGAFEIAPFDAGTVATAREAARLTKDGRLVSVGGGGDTVAALAAAGVTDDFTYVSTAGGAFLEWMEGKALPGVVALEDAARGKPA